METQRAQRGVAATKSEARNPKLETNPNGENPNDPNEFKSMDKICLTKFREIAR